MMNHDPTDTHKPNTMIDLYSAPFLRRCEVLPLAQPRPETLRDILLREDGIQSDFSLLDAPLPPLDQTRFVWAGNKSTLLLGVAFSHSARAPLYPDNMEGESLELFVDLRGDSLGWQQLIFESRGGYHENSHLPYPEMHSSAFPLLKPAKWETSNESVHDYLGAMGCRWFWVWFDAREVFRYGDSVGFNLFRSRDGGEFSGWSFPAGNGAPDATAFGVLSRSSKTAAPDAYKKPRRVKVVAPSADFTLGVTYDPPDNIVYAPLTPERIGEEMSLLKNWGVSRMHWIDYSNFPAIWEYHSWHENMHATLRACGNLVECAARQAQAGGLEFIVDFKPFDYGISSTSSENGFLCNPNTPGAVLDLEGDYIAAIPEIAEHQEWTLQSNSAWLNENTGPAATLRFFSDEPFRELKPSQVKLWVSDDNVEFRPYRGRFAMKQATVSRPHERWTPGGNVREKGSERNWVLELTGLRLREPYAALHIEGDEVNFSQRGFRVMEAEDAQGRRLPAVTATSMNNIEGQSRYAFWKVWPGWANITEPLLQRRRWSGADLGFALRQMPNMPTLLEPTYEGARQVWLDRIAAILDAGADGVNLRFFNHHNGVMSYLHYAFAPVVVEEFRSRFGREPQPTAEDYEQVRRLRGAAMTQLVRDARTLAKSRGKKLMTQLESGIEVPPHLDTRMQLHIDWQRWLREGLVDEVNLKFWTPYSRFVREQVMPLAAKCGVPVHVVSRNLSGLILHPRALETIPQQVEDARKLGFSGFNYYEAGDLYERNPAGGIWTKGLAGAALSRARDRVVKIGPAD